MQIAESRFARSTSGWRQSPNCKRLTLFPKLFFLNISQVSHNYFSIPMHTQSTILWSINACDRVLNLVKELHCGNVVSTPYIIISYLTVMEGDTDMQVTHVSWYTACYTWVSNYTAATTSHYELYCVPVNSTDVTYNRTVILDGMFNNYTLKVSHSQ